jgi:hypothetical protein
VVTLGKGYNATRQRMYQMSKAGDIRLVAHGKYTLPNNPNNTNNPNNRFEDVGNVRGVSRSPNNDPTQKPQR